MAHHALGRDDLAVGADIVGDVEQAGDEQSVGGDAFRLHHVAGCALRHQLGHEAAFGADRHDHRVLDLLRLHQAEHLGAEILRPVRPADAAARHLAEAQVHAFHARRIDEDLVERARQRQAGKLAALELDRDDRLRLAVFVGLEEIGADRRLHGVDELAQDAVLVQALDRLQGLFDLVVERRLFHVAAVRRRRARIEAGVEQFDDIAGDAGMLRQRRPHVVLRIGHADLAQEARQRADQRHVAPAERTGQRERVIAVVLGGAAHHHQEGGFQPRLVGVEIDEAAVVALEQHVVQPEAFAILRRDAIGALVDHAEAHVLQHRHALRQRQRPRQAPHLQADLAALFRVAVAEIDAERPLRGERFDHADVVGGGGRRIDSRGS